MQDFFTIAKTDFLDTFQGAWIFPLLLIVLVFILWKEKDDMRKLLLGVLPLLFLFIYWRHHCSNQRSFRHRPMIIRFRRMWWQSVICFQAMFMHWYPIA